MDQSLPLLFPLIAEMKRAPETRYLGEILERLIKQVEQHDAAIRGLQHEVHRLQTEKEHQMEILRRIARDADDLS